MRRTRECRAVVWGTPASGTFLRRAILVAIVLISTSVGSAQANGDAGSDRMADLVIFSGKVWRGGATWVGTAHEPEAVAIRDGKIVVIGTDADAHRLVGRSTKTINAMGRRIIPGICDSHTHLIGGGLQLERLFLRDASDRKAFVLAVGDWAKKTEPGKWVLGGRWSVDSWSDPSPPRRDWIDGVTGDTPVFLSRMDGHQALANSAALRLAGIDKSGPADPIGGIIERDAETGEPTGILKDAAMDLVRSHIPAPTDDDRDKALVRAMNHANSLGITSVHDMSHVSDLAAFRRAHKAGALWVRITAYLESEDWASDIDRAASFDPRDDWLSVAGLKGYMDGSLGSRTAYMAEPYADATPASPKPRGLLTAFAGGESFMSQVMMVEQRGLQMAVHAIGDQANHLILNAYARALGVTGRSHKLQRIEHAQHLLIEDIPRFAKLGVVASMQPFHKADDGRYAEKAIGKDRLAGSYAYRQLLDAGALLCFGSDWPVVTLDPFAGVDAAVNAKTTAGDVWLASHSIKVIEAMRAYTVAPAKVIGKQDRLGTIEEGMIADLAILTRDPFSVPRDQLNTVTVAVTIVGGKVVYRSEK